MKKYIISGLLSLFGAGLTVTAQEIILTQNFGPVFPTPNGWFSSELDEDGETWQYWGASEIEAEELGFSGQVGVSMNFSIDTGLPLTPENLYVSPPINLSSYGSASLSFNVGALDLAGSDLSLAYKVYALTEGQMMDPGFDLTAVTPHYEGVMTSTTGATDIDVDISALTGITMRVVFLHTTSAGMGALLLDDIVITGIPLCLPPTNLMASAVTSDAANISWTASASAPSEGYDYYIDEENTAPDGDTEPTGSTAAGTTDVDISTGLEDGTVYYIWVRSNCGNDNTGAWSAALSIVTNAVQPLCGNATIADLTAIGSAINWYADAAGGSPLTTDTALANDTVYYATQTIGGCESARVPVITQINVVSAPTGEAEQTIVVDIATDATIEDIVAEGEGMIWYGSESDALAGITPLATGTQLETGTTYYATQTISGCASTTVLAVEITVSLGIEHFDNASFHLYPNPVSGKLNLSYGDNITSVSVLNLLGQEIIRKTVNATIATIDMSVLSEGTYLVKVIAGNATRTVKVIKK